MESETDYVLCVESETDYVLCVESEMNSVLQGHSGTEGLTTAQWPRGMEAVNTKI